ncbi:MAG: hypothetical protein DSY43_02710 [Gammaproteobacteria bacterium]|nr:MAG: hypothetical protein DSY43_02710 [Gammaproteobacteria bacterium]
MPECIAGRDITKSRFTLLEDFYTLHILYFIDRHILAAVHFNENLHRDIKSREVDGQERIKIVYPKFKNGEATIRNIRVKPTFGE